jgi:hypothetical protein
VFAFRSYQSKRLMLLVGFIAFVTAIIVRPGDLGSDDTKRRLQAAHSFWTSAPAVFPDEYPRFGLVGRGGRVYPWYGMGQSLIMLPADVIATVVIESNSQLAEYAKDRPLRVLLVGYMTAPWVTALGIMLCMEFLLSLNFTAAQAASGALSLLFATTFLHYSQNMTENNYILSLTLAGFYFYGDWLRTYSKRSLAFGSIAFGLNLLTRLTTLLDLAAGCIFIVVYLVVTGTDRTAWKERAREFLKVAVPCLLPFIVIDRLYQFYRFGSIFDTYYHLLGIQQKAIYPSLPANFPYSTPFLVGALGPLFSPEKSIFLFDPLLVVLVLVVVLAWSRFNDAIHSLLVTYSVLLVAYIIFYAKYYDWGGDVAWGDRFVISQVHLFAMLAVPLLICYRKALPKWAKVSAAFLTVSSVAIQLSSVVFWPALEYCQLKTMSGHKFVVVLRLFNIIAAMTGKFDQWHLGNIYTHASLHSRVPYPYPFWIWSGHGPHWAAVLIMSVWCALTLILSSLLFSAIRSILPRKSAAEISKAWPAASPALPTATN